MPDKVILVHGTFAFDEFDDVPDGQDSAVNRLAKWWQQGSRFATRIETAAGVSIPLKTPYSLVRDLMPRFHWFANLVSSSQKPDHRVFRWSGENSESIKCDAGQRLLQHLTEVDKACEADNTRFHVVAHSHGGGVLWEALCLAARRPGQLSRLGKWIAVGTPFLRFRWQLSAFVATLLLLCALILGLLSWPLPFVDFQWAPWRWFVDYWSRFDAVSNRTPIENFALALGLFVFTVLLACSCARALWATYAYRKGRQTNTGDRRRIDRRELASAWFTFGCVLSVSLVAPAYWELRAGAAWTQIKTAYLILCSARGAFGLAAFLLTSVTVATVGWLFLASVGRFFEERRRSQVRLRAWKQFGDKFVAIASRQDEAIYGLKAIESPPRGPLLPRIQMPRKNRFGEWTKRARFPERERQRAGTTHLIGSLLALPVMIIWDWIARPFYNDVFAELVDTFVLTRLWKQAYGCDLFGLLPDRVLVTPLDPQDYQVVCPVPIDPDDVAELTEEPLKNTVLNIRRTLGREYPVGANLREFFKDAMAGEKSAAEALIHTTYFESSTVSRLVTNSITGQPLDSFKVHSGSNLSVEIDAEQADPESYDFLAWVARCVVLTILFVLPLVAVHATNWLVFYRHSAAFYMQDWKAENGVLVARLTDFEHPQSSNHVNWGVYMSLMNRFGLASPNQMIQDEFASADLRDRASSRYRSIDNALTALIDNPSPPSLDRSALDEFLDPWDSSKVDRLTRPSAQWLELRHALGEDQVREIEKRLDPSARLAAIKNWLQASEPQDMPSRQETAVRLLTDHARICWKTTSKHLRRHALDLLNEAETIRSKAERADSSQMQRMAKAICLTYARIGKHDQAKQLAAQLQQEDLIEAAIAAAIHELNRPFNLELDNALSRVLTLEWRECFMGTPAE